MILTRYNILIYEINNPMIRSVFDTSNALRDIRIINGPFSQPINYVIFIAEEKWKKKKV